MSEAVKWLVDDLKSQSDVAGILLTAMEKSCVNVVVVARQRRRYYRRGRTMKGMWIEEYFNTYERLMEAIRRKEEAHIHIFKKGRVLYDPKGHVSELRELAKRTLPKYKESEEDLSKILREPWRRIFRSLIKFRRVPDKRISEHVLAVLRGEWGESPRYLMQAQWAVRWVDLNELMLDIEVLASDLFMKEIGERMKFLQTRIQNDEPIEPIITIENKQLWLIDGYARLYALTRLGLKESMAYVGHVKGFTGP